jgi:hypothetical protein
MRKPCPLLPQNRTLTAPTECPLNAASGCQGVWLGVSLIPASVWEILKMAFFIIFQHEYSNC